MAGRAAPSPPPRPHSHAKRRAPSRGAPFFCAPLSSRPPRGRRAAALARKILGGNGILTDNRVARLFTDAEATYTYEGANEINLLIALSTPNL